MYHVQIINGLPIVVLTATGQPVPGAQVNSVHFPSQISEAGGKTSAYISGPGTAYITVSGQSHSSVPLR